METGGDPARVGRLIAASAPGAPRCLDNLLQLDSEAAAEAGLNRRRSREERAAAKHDPIADPSPLLARYLRRGTTLARSGSLESVSATPAHHVGCTTPDGDDRYRCAICIDARTGGGGRVMTLALAGSPARSPARRNPPGALRPPRSRAGERLRQRHRPGDERELDDASWRAAASRATSWSSRPCRRSSHTRTSTSTREDVRERRPRGSAQKGKDNGALIVVAMKERQVRVEVGYDLEEFITDGFAGETIREVMTPQFRNNAYGAGPARGHDADHQPHRRAPRRRTAETSRGSAGHSGAEAPSDPGS